MDKPNDADGGTDAPDLAHFLHHDHSGDTHPQAAVRAPSGAPVKVDALRDVEKSLVERIADVDDDRRRSTQQMQKAWQTQRREIEHRLARQRGVLIALVAVLLVTIIGGLAWAYQGLDQLRRSVDMRLATFAPAAVETTADPAEIAALAARLADTADALSSRQAAQEARLDSLAEGLERASGAAAEGALDEAALMQRLEPLRQRQTRLERQFDAMQARVEAAPDPGPGAGMDERLPARAERQRAVEPETSPPPAAATPPEPMRVGKRPYALQLLGAFDRDAVLRLARRDFAGVPVYLREETYRGRPWYVLIHSLHASNEAALAAKADLPEAVAGMDVWIRPLPADTLLQPVLAEPSPEVDGD